MKRYFEATLRGFVQPRRNVSDVVVRIPPMSVARDNEDCGFEPVPLARIEQCRQIIAHSVTREHLAQHHHVRNEI